MNIITLYGTEDCHLCEEAMAVIYPVLDRDKYHLVVVDIARPEHQALFESYALRIPVIKRQDRDDDLGWPFDTQQLVAYLQ